MAQTIRLPECRGMGLARQWLAQVRDKPLADSGVWQAGAVEPVGCRLCAKNTFHAGADQCVYEEEGQAGLREAEAT
jgi:hypothetical protein